MEKTLHTVSLAAYKFKHTCIYQSQLRLSKMYSLKLWIKLTAFMNSELPNILITYVRHGRQLCDGR